MLGRCIILGIGSTLWIPEATNTEILEKKELSAGRYEIIEDVETFKYPLKIVVAVENDIITVVSSYPLKKGRKP
jgi:hypothetical protein